MELVFIPTPGMGHLRSTFELAKLITQRNDSVSALILIMNHPLESSTVNAYVDSQSRDFHPSSRLTFLTLPPLPNPPDMNSINLFGFIIDGNKPLVKQTLEDRVRAGSPKPAGLVLHVFCSAMIPVANKLGVHSYIFFTLGPSFLNLWLHFQSLAHDQGVDLATMLSDPDVEIDVPGFNNRVPRKVVPGMFLDEGCVSMMNVAKGIRLVKGILLNTFMELDSYTIKSLLDQTKSMDNGKNNPVFYPIGPVLELSSETPVGSKKEEQDSIMRWLDEQPTSSVVFLCFGSLGSFDDDQVIEIANGLDRSGHRFLWSLRRADGKLGMLTEDDTLALPKGFLDRTAHRGKIIGWAPQIAILAHPAVGGFVSHCGWNSILESLWFGVPLAVWPMYAEQPVNAFTVVKEMELAVEIRMDYRRDWLKKKRNMVVTAEEVENGVKKLMSKDNVTRERVKEMSKKCRKAIEDGGSSHAWMGRFIEDVYDNAALN